MSSGVTVIWTTFCIVKQFCFFDFVIFLIIHILGISLFSNLVIVSSGIIYLWPYPGTYLVIHTIFDFNDPYGLKMCLFLVKLLTAIC